jgi:hypothetical protein
MDAKELYDKLKKVQEPKGYYFSNNHERVMELLDALLVNKDRYGYMVCPCRLASGDRDNDRTSSAPATTGSPTWPNSAPAIAICMFPRNGTTVKSTRNTSLSGGHPKK